MWIKDKNKRNERDGKLAHVGVAIISLGVEAVSGTHKGIPWQTAYLQAYAPAVFTLVILTPVSACGRLSTVQLLIITRLAGGYRWYL